MGINYDNLDKAYKKAQEAPFPRMAERHLLDRIIEAGPPENKEDSEKLAAFLKKLFWGDPTTTDLPN